MHHREAWVLAKMAKALPLQTEQSNKLQVKLAFLHQSVSIPGALNTEKTLNKTKFPGLEMFWDGMALWIHLKGQIAIIPAANVAIAVVEQ
jgi:hypothetical protein